MDESASKGGDNDADENSPPKKAKTDDLEQPPTSSSSSGPASSSSNMASNTSASTERPSASASAPGNGQSESDTGDSTEQRDVESLGDAAAAAPAAINVAAINAAAANAVSALRIVSRDSSRERNAGRNRPASSDDDAGNDDAYIDHMERSVQRLVHRNVRNLSNLRARARNGAANGDQDGAANAAAGDDPASGSDGDERREHIRIRNQLADNIVELLAPGLFPPVYDDTSDDSDDFSGGAELYDDVDNNRLDEEHNRGFEFEVEHNSSSNTSSSNSSSASTLSSSSDSSESYIHTSESEYDYVDLPHRNEQNVENLECLQTSSVKCKWNIVREISQRQHGVAFHKTPATVGRYNPSQFQTRAYGSVHLVQRLGLLHKLAHHTGCVNSLNFHPSGKLLASGSDDLRINLWHWESKKLLKSIRSGHKNNVFQTKFMTCDGYENEIEIISTGRDGHVRHTTVKPSGHATTKVIFRSQHAIHKVAIPARNDLVFLMAGEDEKVRLCDMRQAKVQTVVDVGKRLYSISTHPYDSEFCVSGSGSAVRVYDLRRAQKPLRMLFVGEQAEGQRSFASVTCAVYNHDGTEILASYSDDDIYLFKLDPPDGILVPTDRFRGHW
uniref:Uncharacterized protein n=1 Tax=Anopheles christyi TaxID=43041 RepID=A0A182K976_9DIPT